MNLRNLCPKPRAAALLWLAATVVAAAMLWRLLPNSALSADVLDLLPQVKTASESPALYEGAAHLAAQNNQRVIWAVKSPAGDDAPARALVKRLQAIDGLTDIMGRTSDDARRAWLSTARDSAPAFMDDATLGRLEKGSQVRWAVAQLFAPVAAPGKAELMHDPLLLMRSTQLGAPAGGAMRWENGWLTVPEKAPSKDVWRFITASSAPDLARSGKLSAFSTAVRAAQDAVMAQYPQTQIVSQGAVFYSDYAAKTTVADMTRLGSLSIAGLLLLLWWAFRSVRPMALTLVSIGVGALFGTVATLTVFGGMHAVTLLMCLSLVGICADYTTYYMAERMVNGHLESPVESMKGLRPALIHALLSTMAAYGLMILAPFPGLQQLAVFAVAALSASCLTVLLWFPYLVSGLPVRPAPGAAFFAGWQKAWQRSPIFPMLLLGVVLAFIAGGAVRLNINDDLHALQARPAALANDEAVLQRLLKRDFSQTWFVVQGDTLDAAAAAAQRLNAPLSAAVKAGEIAHFDRFPILSTSRQQKVIALIDRAMPQAVARFTQMGLPVKAKTYAVLPPKVWLDGVGHVFKSNVYLTDTAAFILIPVQGVTRPEAMAALAQKMDGVAWVNRRGDYETLFSQYRRMIAWLLAGALALIGASFVHQYGARRGVFALFPVILAMGAAVAATGLAGWPLNIFSLFALILVLGIGVDYVVFFVNMIKFPHTVLFAMSVALASTLLSLGILVFSDTAAVQNFGLVLSVGVFTAFITAPMTWLVNGAGKRD